MPSTILSDAYSETNPLNLQHKVLDLNSVTELPDSHAWTSTPNETLSRGSDGGGGMCIPESVPIIDLNHDKATELVGHACKTWGVFQVINHNISKSLLDEIELEGKKLFSLPMHQKLQAARAPDGMSGYGVARISSFFSKLMWSEGFTIVGSPIEHARKLWPEDYHKFCDLIEDYRKSIF